MTEEDTLKKAMQNVAMRNLMKELREAVMCGPKILGDIYTEYQKLEHENSEKATGSRLHE
jgi:hypothetical protein